jgi:hypothetical protein
MTIEERHELNRRVEPALAPEARWSTDSIGGTSVSTEPSSLRRYYLNVDAVMDEMINLKTGIDARNDQLEDDCGLAQGWPGSAA